MKKAIITKRIVSIFLSSITAFMLPSQAFATNLSDKNIKYSSFDDIQGNGEKVANIVMELEEERTENTKLFLLDDGSKMLAEYTEPIHYKNDNNEWAEYNNTLVAENALYSADYDTDYTNKSSNLNIKLSKKAKPQNMINISDDEYSISWGYENTNKSNIIIDNNDVDLNENDKFTSVENIASKVTYENVYKNVDLQYFVTTTGVKENIILKNSDVQNEFYISYKTKKLTAKQTDDYTITLYNKDNTPVYMINAPYMVDEKGEASSQLKLEILSQNGVNLNIKLTADYDYVHSSNRSYPITIDPELTNKFSSELYLNEVYGNSTLNHGPYYISNDHYIVANLLKLPELDEGEKIISAKYNFEIKNGSSLFANETDSLIIINAHKLNGIENGVVSYESDILDYDSLSYNDNSKFTFDLTKLTKEWYDNGDKVDGFVIEGLDTAESRIANLKESTRTSATPSITIIYKDYSGTESNLSYHTVSAGYNAQAKVSDYLGNLVVSQKLYEGTGARMPVTISATYNSIKNNDISGCGWYFSFEQCIKETNKNLSNAGYNYIYIDTEGTSHYLKKSSSEEKWLGEDGLGITLSVKEDCIIVENGNTTQTFDTVANGGKILSETDKNGNTVTYSYTNGYLSSITDGSGRIIQLRYTGKPDGSKRINQVTLPDNEKISIYYNSSEIDTISAFVFPDKKTSAFYYDKNNKITKEQLQNRTLENTAVISKHCFIYNEKGQVTKITEYGKNNSEGNYLNITYSNDNTTVFEDRNGLKTTYTFDNKGVLMSVLNANGYLESNHSSGLQNTSGADSFTKNILAESYEFSTIGTNKYYTKSNGKINGVQSKDGICEIDSSKPSKEDGTFQYFGSNSIKISNPVSENNASFYTSAFHDISITDENYIGKELTLSAYVKTKNVKWKTLDEAFGALLEVEFYDFFANLLDSKTSIGISETEDWQRISVTVTVPESTRTMRIKCSVKNATGTAWFDCLQLEEGNCANDFNALQNSDFESNDYWFTNDKKSISTKEGVVSLGGKEGVFVEPTSVSETMQSENKEIEESTSVKIVDVAVPNSYIYEYDDYGNVISEFHGTVDKKVKKYYFDEPTEETNTSQTETTQPIATSGEGETESNDNNSYIYQNINVDRAYVSFNLVGEAQAKSVPLTNDTRTFGIVLNIFYEGNSIPETHYQEFNAYTTQKQTVNMAVAPNLMDKVIDYVSFAFVYNNNSNTMKISNSMLNIISYPVKFESDTVEDSSTEKGNTGNSDIEYDGYFYCEALSESPNYNNTYIQNNMTYDTSGNYATAKTNQAGNTVYYSYDVNGNVTSAEDGEENQTSYTYNKDNSVASVSSEEVRNEYSYDEKGSIVTITHNGFNYDFSYDDYGNLLSTNVGNAALTTSTYLKNNGELQKTDFANGDYVEYCYDNFNRITQLKGENGVIAEFIYNKKGKVAKVVDYSAKRTTMYYYDFTGAVSGNYCQTEDDIVLYFLGVNENGEKVEKTNIAGFERTITSGVDNGTPFVESDGVSVSRKSDEFERVTSVETEDTQKNAVFITNYEYTSGNSANSTTSLVSKITQKYKNNSLVNYEYSYDGNGNITEVKRNGTKIAQYGYDGLNQITNYADSTTGIFARFNYDNSGNITKINIYKLKQNGWIPSDLISVKTYTYSDTNWKDKLTEYNGTNITYDESGNPLSYRDGMSFAWENGRNLKTVSTGSNTITMQYDSEGLRTQKKYNDERINYYYDNNKNLTGMDASGIVLFFHYDSNGNVIAMSRYGNKYYYVKNLQGDIEEIVDSSGKAVVTYTYDVFGKIISQTDTSDCDLANINPFRYRGYVYDSETGLYYLKSRYYDPVTGRFLNADMYCDTQSNIFGTNMFAYCNNNWVNQIDPEGTDAIWLQFPDGANGFGHTSLLLQDSADNWWYFYWGPKHAILRPCGKESFTVAELNSYLSGFDPRNKHNYYVYAINVYNDRDDLGSNASSYWRKMHDGVIKTTDSDDKKHNGTIKFKGNFTKSYNYAFDLLINLYKNSNANEMYRTVKEKNKTITIIDVRAVIYPDKGNINQILPDAICPVDFYYDNIKGNGECKSYSLNSYNCVQSSMDILLQGTFSSESKKYKDKIKSIYGNVFKRDFHPNKVYNKLINC